MAKKKRKHRNPVAPPIHSAPATSHGPAGPRTPPPATTRPTGTEPPAAPVEPTAKPARTKEKARPRTAAAARRRRQKIRTWLIVGTVIALIAGAFIAQQVISGRALRELTAVGRSAGCGDGVDKTEAGGAGQHLGEGERTTYDTKPPTDGEHAAATLPEGVYDEPLSADPLEAANVYRAVHSLEHGAVIIWHDGLPKDDQTELERRYRDEEKVIVAPYDGLPRGKHMALTAWGFVVRCEGSSTAVADRFIDLYRSARSAPEPRNPI